MRQSWMIAECFRRYAWWRLNRVDSKDGGGNARSALALLDAAAYTERLGADEPVVARLTETFDGGTFRLSPSAERLVRYWHYDSPGGDPEDLLRALATAMGQAPVPAPRVAGRARP